MKKYIAVIAVQSSSIEMKHDWTWSNNDLDPMLFDTAEAAKAAAQEFIDEHEDLVYPKVMVREA